jgi:WD40 repeat protein
MRVPSRALVLSLFLADYSPALLLSQVPLDQGPTIPGAVRPPVTALAVAPGSEFVVLGSQSGLELRSWPDLKFVHKLSTELANIHDLAFSPDGKVLAVVGGEPAERGSVELFAWPAKQLLHRFHPHQDLIYGIAWRSDSSEFATGSADQKVGLHEAMPGRTLRFLEGHSRGVLALAFLPGDAQLLTAGIDETIRLWDAGTGQPVRSLANHTRPVNHLAVRPSSADGAPPWVASVSEDRTVRLWQPTIGRMVRFTRLETVPAAVGWSADGKILFVACKDGHLRTIDPETAAVLDDQPAITGICYCLALASDGSVVVGGQGGQLRRIVLKPSP